MKNPLPSIARTVPLFAGPALALIPRGELAQVAYLRRFTIFLLLVVFIGCLKFLLTKLYAKPAGSDSPASEARVGKYLKRPLIYRGREIFEVVLLIGATFVALLAMQSYQDEFAPDSLSLLLVAILAGSVELRLRNIGTWPLCEGLAAFVAGISLSYLSIAVSTEQWLWQTLVISLAFGVGSAALALARFIDLNTAASPRQRTHVSRALVIATVLGPLALGAMVQLGELPPAYLLTFLVIPAVFPIFNKLPAYEESGVPPNRLSAAVAAAILLFVVIVAAVSVGYRP